MFRLFCLLGLASATQSPGGAISKMVSSASPSPLRLKVVNPPRVFADAALLSALKDEASSTLARGMSEILQMHSKSSFLQQDSNLGSNLKHALFLTQGLRSPPQMSMSVIEKENVSARAQKAKYMALASKARYLMEDSFSKLSALRG